MMPVLVIQLARFGDLVQTKRLVSCLQASGATVHLLVDDSLAGLARIVYPDVRLHGLAAHARPDPVRMRRTLDELSGLDFQAVYNLNFSGLTTCLTSLFDPAIVRGYRLEAGQAHKDPWAAMAFRWAGRRRLGGLNLVDFWAGFAWPLNDPRTVNPPAAPRGGGLGVVLAGRHARRSLPPDVLAPLVGAALAPLVGAALAGLSRPTIVLLGSQAEHGAAKALLSSLPLKLQENTRDLTGRTDWPDLAEELSGLDRVLTPDTGTMHLAAHLGVPVTAFFLSSAWGHETGPYGLGHTIWQAAPECAPCLEAAACPQAMACLEPFRERGLMRLLGGKTAATPPAGLLGYTTDFDDLGVVQRPLAGQDPDSQARERYRAFLARHLGLGPGGSPAPDLAEWLEADPDFMLDKHITLPDPLL
jgi:ADP-heptose:LPS heptosyltransferase